MSLGRQRPFARAPARRSVSVNAIRAQAGGGGRVVDGILVTFNRPTGLRESLAAIAAQDPPLRRLWIVDNGDPAASTIDSVTERRVGPDLRHIVTGENLGPAGGYARGLDRVLSDDDPADWVALFDDNDPPTSPSIVAGLTAAGEELLRRGVPVGGLGLRGARMQWLRGRVTLPPLEGDLVEVDHLHGGYVPVYRLEALRRCPNFDPLLFFGFEELAFGLGLSGQGFPLYVHARMWSQLAAKYQQAQVVSRPTLTGIGEARRRYYSLRNLIWILRRHGHPVVAARVAMSRGLLKPLFNLLLGRRRTLPVLALSARGVVDAYRGNMGRTVDISPSESPQL